MFAYSIVEHQQGSSVEVINFLWLICLELANSHIKWIHLRQQDFGSIKELNYKLAAFEVFLLNWNAFAFVASLKIYCTSRRVILRTFCCEIFNCIGFYFSAPLVRARFARVFLASPHSRASDKTAMLRRLHLS